MKSIMNRIKKMFKMFVLAVMVFCTVVVFSIGTSTIKDVPVGYESWLGRKMYIAWLHGFGFFNFPS